MVLHQIQSRCRAGAGRRAFTLIEILIVVALMSIAATILIPSMTNVANFGTESFVRQIVADLTFTQSDAMAHQSRRRILFKDDGTGYRILAYPFDPDNDVLYDPLSNTGNGKYIIDLTTDTRFRNIHIDSAVFDDDQHFLTYDEIGGPVASDGTPSTGGSIVVSGNNERYQIDVSAFTGRVSVTKVAP